MKDMKLIDEKKRLFGLFNIVDLCILVLVFAVAAAVYYFFSGTVLPDSTPETNYSVTIEFTAVEKDLLDAIKTERTVFDKVQNKAFGTLKAVRSEPASEYALSTEDGTVSRVEIPERYDVWVDIEITTDRSLAVGEQLRISTKDFTCAGYIVSITKAD